MLGISVDSVPSHIAFQQYQTGKLGFPVASDFFPHGAVAKKYGILRQGSPIPGISERAIFIIDKQGKIAFAKIYHLGEQPDLDEVLAALRQLNRKQKS